MWHSFHFILYKKLQNDFGSVLWIIVCQKYFFSAKLLGTGSYHVSQNSCI